MRPGPATGAGELARRDCVGGDLAEGGDRHCQERQNCKLKIFHICPLYFSVEGSDWTYPRSKVAVSHFLCAVAQRANLSARRNAPGTTRPPRMCALLTPRKADAAAG